jgi:hypothetical protein
VTAAEALAALGDTPDAVAETLRAGGWRGQRASCESCPLARYLAGSFGGEWMSASTETLAPFGWVRHPQPVAEFVVRFDRGHYPDLVAE